jgi:hypothetical protein
MPETPYDPLADPVELLEDLPLDGNPTDALPGTPEKEAVFQDRIRRGRNIFHPLDARLPDKAGFAPVAGARGGDYHRGLLLVRDRDDYSPAPDQMERPASRRYSDGPGAEERRKRSRARAADPEVKRRDAARRKATRAFQKRKRLHAIAAEEAALPSLSASR